MAPNHILQRLFVTRDLLAPYTETAGPTYEADHLALGQTSQIWKWPSLQSKPIVHLITIAALAQVFCSASKTKISDMAAIATTKARSMVMSTIAGSNTSPSGRNNSLIAAIARSSTGSLCAQNTPIWRALRSIC